MAISNPTTERPAPQPSLNGGRVLAAGRRIREAWRRIYLTGQLGPVYGPDDIRAMDPASHREDVTWQGPRFL